MCFSWCIARLECLELSFGTEQKCIFKGDLSIIPSTIRKLNLFQSEKNKRLLILFRGSFLNILYIKPDFLVKNRKRASGQIVWYAYFCFFTKLWRFEFQHKMAAFSEFDPEHVENNRKPLDVRSVRFHKSGFCLVLVSKCILQRKHLFKICLMTSHAVFSNF